MGRSENGPFREWAVPRTVCSLAGGPFTWASFGSSSARLRSFAPSPGGSHGPQGAGPGGRPRGRKQPSQIKNKLKRAVETDKLRVEKKKSKKRRLKERERAEKRGGGPGGAGERTSTVAAHFDLPRKCC